MEHGSLANQTLPKPQCPLASIPTRTCSLCCLSLQELFGFRVRREEGKSHGAVAKTGGTQFDMPDNSSFFRYP